MRPKRQVGRSVCGGSVRMLVVLLLPTVAFVLGIPAASAGGAAVDLVSVGANGGDVSSSAFAGASEDGRFVFFSTPDDLVPEDADGLCPRGFDDWTGQQYPPTPCVDVYERD